jgi:hypothetical protein
MSTFKSTFLLSLTFLLVLSVFAETETDSIISANVEKHITGFSIGINDLPWDAREVSFRWWRKNEIGRELTINKSYIRYSRQEETEEDSLGIGIEETNREKYINIPEITYSFLNRKPLGAERMYLVKGIGIGLGFRISYDDTYAPENNISREYKYYEGTFTIHFPIGIEHFFLEKYPNISYSLSADIYGTTTIYNRKDITSYPDSYPYTTRANNIWNTQTSFGISPTFYLRAYF